MSSWAAVSSRQVLLLSSGGWSMSPPPGCSPGPPLPLILPAPHQFICIHSVSGSLTLLSTQGDILCSHLVVSDSSTPWTAACQASLSFTIFWSLLKLMSIELVMPSNHLIICHPLLPSIFPSIRVFSNELALRIRWPKYWSFSFSISFSIVAFF